MLFKISKFKLFSGLFRRLHIINVKCILSQVRVSAVCTLGVVYDEGRGLRSRSADLLELEAQALLTDLSCTLGTDLGPL